MKQITHKRIVNLWIALVLFLLFIVGALVVIGQEAIRQKVSIEKDVSARANALREYLLVPAHLLQGLQGAMQEHLYLAEAGMLEIACQEYMEEFIEHNIYALYPQARAKEPRKPFSMLDMVGTLTGTGSVSQIDDEKQKEIIAALSLNALFESVLTSLPDVKWVYYTSSRHFVYLAPVAAIDQYFYQEEHQQKAFWQEAIPENNPTHKLIVTSPYLDLGGKGFMVTLSLPVMYRNEFRGVLSVDIGLDSLIEELQSVETMGGSALLSENQQVIVKQASLKTTAMDQGVKNILYLEDILGNEVRLLHKVPYYQVVVASVQASFVRLLLLASLVIMVYLLYRQCLLGREIRNLADTDPLTQLMNRRAMSCVVQSMIEYNCRYQQSISFMLLDIDNFKSVNDSYGHAVGDEVLIAVCDELKLSVRAADQISRHGGEEFLIVSPRSNLNEVYLLAERVRKNIEQKKFSSKHIFLTVSIGCAQFSKDETYSDVLNRADKALYRAKSLGRNRTEKAS